MIVLISDGYSYDLPGQDQEIARDFKAEGIAVFCIIVGGFEPQPEIVNICRLTGGEAFRADDPGALPAVFKKIDEMKQAKVAPTMVEPIDYYEPFTLAGLSLLARGHAGALRAEVHAVVIPLPKLPATDIPGVTPVVAGFVVAGVVVLLAVAAEAIHFRRVLRAAPWRSGRAARGWHLRP